MLLDSTSAPKTGADGLLSTELPKTTEVFGLLLAAVADVNAMNNNGGLPLDMDIQYRGYPNESVEILGVLTPKTASSVGLEESTEKPIVDTSALTIERAGERTEVRWREGVLQFSTEVDGKWRDIILDQGFFIRNP